MICQYCGLRPANMLVRRLANGELTQFHLCETCARELGVGSLFAFHLETLLGREYPEPVARTEEKRCPQCGLSFGEITEAGRVGCAECYRTFRRELAPVLRQLHGTAAHRGKKPAGTALRLVPPAGPIVPVEPTALEEKKRQLRQAVENQQFERAAVLRDEIKEMEQHGE